MFYIDRNGMPQAGGIGGLLLFGGLSALLLYIKINRYVKPADSEWTAARNMLRQARTNRSIRKEQEIFRQSFIIITIFPDCGILSVKEGRRL